ncbi:MAG: hypothetical protein QOK25_1540 [Thermoleophilaceae bacterium]|nr:hypothetical protein [Thermoleophilaceae bacterium]
MRRRDGTGPLILAAAAVTGALAVSAASAIDLALGAGVQPDSTAGAAGAPVAVLRATPAAALVGNTILLDGSASHAADGHGLRYTWDLNGDGVYETGTGQSPRLRDILATPGAVVVGLRVIDERGAYSDDHVRLSAAVLSDQTLMSGGHAVVAGGERLVAATRRARAGATGAASAPLHAAAATTVTVKNFLFAPKAITVHVGDTVTWSNQGPLPHSATADDGSFNTGVMKKGGSGAFRFTKAGTFHYHCIPHPTTMKATIVVAAASGSSAPTTKATTPGSTGTGGSNSTNPGTSGSHSSSGSSLPHTGLQLGLLAAAGLALLGSGVALRRRLVHRGGAEIDN